MLHMGMLATVAAIAVLASVVNCSCPSQRCVDTEKCVMTGIEGEACLHSAIKGMQWLAPKKLILDSLDLKQGLPAGTFRVLRGNKPEKIVFRKYLMESLSSSTENPFLGLEQDVKSMYFLNADPDTNMRNWNWQHLSIMQLKKIVVSHVPPDAFARRTLPTEFKFAGGGSITTVKITSNCLHELAPESLSTFVNVEVINLSGNKILSLKRNVFPKTANRLRFIDLSNNIISVLDSKGGDRFWDPDLPSLMEVYLEYNTITRIEEDLVLNANIKKFSLNGNQLRCDEDLEWILDVKPEVYNLPGVEEVVCYTPKHLKGTPVSKLNKTVLNSYE